MTIGEMLTTAEDTVIETNNVNAADRSTIGDQEEPHQPANIVMRTLPEYLWSYVVESVSSFRKMATLSSTLSLAFSLLFAPFLIFLLAILFLASIGRSLGVRRLYIKCLLILFEVSDRNIRYFLGYNNQQNQYDFFMSLLVFEVSF